MAWTWLYPGTPVTRSYKDWENEGWIRKNTQTTRLWFSDSRCFGVMKNQKIKRTYGGAKKLFAILQKSEKYEWAKPVSLIWKFADSLTYRNCSITKIDFLINWHLTFSFCILFWLWSVLQHCNSFWLWRCPWSFENGHRVHCGLHQWYPQVNSHQQWWYLTRTSSRCEKNPEMNTTLRCGNGQSLLMCTVILCKMPCDQKYKKEAGLAHI